MRQTLKERNARHGKLLTIGAYIHVRVEQRASGVTADIGVRNLGDIQSDTDALARYRAAKEPTSGHYIVDGGDYFALRVPYCGTLIVRRTREHLMGNEIENGSRDEGEIVMVLP